MIESAEKNVQKKLDYVYHKEKSGKSQFPYSEKARHLTTTIRAGGAILAGTAGVVTLAMGKAFIKICQIVKPGKLRRSRDYVLQRSCSYENRV